MRFLSIIGNRKRRSFEKVYLTGEEERSRGFVIGEQSLLNGRLRSGGNTAHGNPRSSEREGGSSIGGRRGEEGSGRKNERRRHCRERSRRSVAKEEGIGMRMVNQSLHMIPI